MYIAGDFFIVRFLSAFESVAVVKGLIFFSRGVEEKEKNDPFVFSCCIKKSFVYDYDYGEEGWN